MSRSIEPALKIINEQKSHTKVSLMKDPNSLRNKKQLKALQLLQREEERDKKSRLESLLFNQFLEKLKIKSSSAISQVLKRTITNYIESLREVTSKNVDIHVLEIQIKNEIKRFKTEQESKLKESNHNISSSNHITIPSKQEEDVHLKENQWPVINAILSVSDEKSQQKELEKKRAEKLKFQQDLQKQIDEKNRLKNLEIEEKKKRYEETEKNLRLYQEEQEKRDQEKRDRFFKERELRLNQIEELKIRRAMDKQKKIEEEKVEMARAKLLEQQEENRRIFQREKEKKSQDILLMENERNKEIKEKQKREMFEYEKKLNAEYQKKLNKEEEERNNAFKNRMLKLKAFQDSYDMEVGSLGKKNLSEEQKMIERNLIEKEKHDTEKELAKIQKRRETSRQTMLYNQQMAEMKKGMQQKFKMDEVEERKKIEKKLFDEKIRAQEEKKKNRKKMLEIKYDLDNQVRMREQKKQEFKEELNGTELTLNKSIIRKLEEDPKLLKQVAEKIHPTNIYSQNFKKTSIF